jgi:branched-chain amino acid transport system ATP-binding protein
MLNVKNVNTYYGKVQALFDVSINIDDQEIISIIGANGAGKSTLMKTIMGTVIPLAGTIEFDGVDITRLRADETVKKGVVYIPEGREIFPLMSVYENLEMGAYSKRYSKTELHEHVESVYELFPRLKERFRQLAGSLSGGEQQMLAIGRGLMSDPKLLMFDEPSLGLAPVIVEGMFRDIVKINEQRKIPIIIVEQNAFMAMMISHRTYALENGEIVITGDSHELIQSDEIKKTYLGG